MGSLLEKDGEESGTNAILEQVKGMDFITVFNEIEDLSVARIIFVSLLDPKSVPIRDGGGAEFFDNFLSSRLDQSTNCQMSNSNRVEKIQATALKAVISRPGVRAASF